MSSPEQPSPLDRIEALSRHILRVIDRADVLDTEPEPRIRRQDGSELPLKHFVLESPHSAHMIRTIEAMPEGDPERAALIASAQKIFDTHMQISLIGEDGN